MAVISDKNKALSEQPLLEPSFSKFCPKYYKVCLTSMDHFVQWSTILFRELETTTQIAKSQVILKKGINILVFAELTSKVTDFSFKILNFTKGKESLKNISICFVKVSNKVAEFCRVLLESNLIFLSKIVANRLLGIQGITMMINSAIKLYSVEPIGNSPSSSSLNMWKTIKHISLLATGFFLTLGSFAGLMNPSIMLIFTTSSLVSTYCVCWLKSKKSNFLSVTIPTASIVNSPPTEKKEKEKLRDPSSSNLIIPLSFPKSPGTSTEKDLYPIAHLLSNCPPPPALSSLPSLIDGSHLSFIAEDLPPSEGVRFEPLNLTARMQGSEAVLAAAGQGQPLLSEQAASVSLNQALSEPLGASNILPTAHRQDATAILEDPADLAQPLLSQQAAPVSLSQALPGPSGASNLLPSLVGDTPEPQPEQPLSPPPVDPLLASFVRVEDLPPPPSEATSATQGSSKTRRKFLGLF